MTALLCAFLLLAVACTEAPRKVRTHQINIRAFQYIPARVTVAAGDTVIWINEDAVPHTATAADRAWDTGSIGSKESGQVVMSQRGESVYVCAFHPNMSSTLVVQ